MALRRSSTLPALFTHRATHPRPLSTTASPDRVAAAISAELAHQKALFSAVYAGTQGPPLEEWMQSFYRRPRPDLLVGGFLCALKTPGAWVGSGALPGSSFLGGLLRPLLRTTPDVELLFATLMRGAVEASGGEEVEGEALPSGAGVPEVMDTVLRGLAFSGTTPGAQFLAATSSMYKQELAVRPLGRGETPGNRAAAVALATSLSPPHPAPPLAEWAIPSLNLPAFEAHIAAQEFSHYGCGSRFLFAHTHAAWAVAATDKAAYRAGAPRLANLVTRGMVDAYWGAFYATGDPVWPLRVLDVGTPYAEFLDEFGDEWVSQYNPSLSRDSSALASAARAEAVTAGAAGDEERAASASARADAAYYSGLPEALVDSADTSPLPLLRFDTSRYALWTLLLHAGTHTSVAQTFFRHASAVNDKLAKMDPVARSEDVTSFGNSRAVLLQALLPAMMQLGGPADQHGIGSGVWPAGFGPSGGDALVGSGGPLGGLLGEAPAPHQAGNAASSTPVTPPRSPRVGSGASSLVSAPGATRPRGQHLTRRR